jgi:hypothetical protein
VLPNVHSLVSAAAQSWAWNTKATEQGPHAPSLSPISLRDAVLELTPTAADKEGTYSYSDSGCSDKKPSNPQKSREGA